MRIRWVIATVAVLTGPAAAAVYKWTDADGVVHYSDRPAPGAEKVELGPLSTFRGPGPRPRAPQPPSPTETGYRRAAIAAPADRSTIRDPLGRVGVEVALDPGLREGHVVQLLVDGQPQGEPAPTTRFALVNVGRGTHTIAAVVRDAAGNEIARTAPVTVFLHRPSVLFRNRPAPPGNP